MDDSGIEKKFIGESTGPGVQPLSAEQQLGELIGQYLPVTEHEDRHWLRSSEPNSKQRFAIVGQHGAIDKRGGVRCRFTVDVFIPSTASDPKTKKLITVRNRTIGRASDGSPIYPGFQIDAWKFCLEFVPELTWMTASEWRSVLAELAPTIARDQAAAAADGHAVAVTREKAQQAAAAADNPSAHLATGIAAGVAQALASLGVEPKTRKGGA
jgi:hypothetical protein